MKLADYLDSSNIILKFEAKDKEEAIKKLAKFFCDVHLKGGVEEASKLYQELIERENLASTGLGDRIAIPHVRDDAFGNDIKMVFAISKKGVDFNSVDGQKAEFILLIVGPKSSKMDEYIQLLAHATRILRNPDAQEKMLQATSPEEVLSIIEQYEST